MIYALKKSMVEMVDLVNVLKTLGQLNLDPVFHAHEAREAVLNAGLKRSEWIQLLEHFEGSPSATVSAGIAGALAKHADQETSPLEFSDLFPFLHFFRLEHIVARNSVLVAVQLWLLRTPIEDLGDQTRRDLLRFLQRSTAEADDPGSQETILEILADFLFDLEDENEEPSSEMSILINEILTALTGLGSSSERLRAEMLESLG